MAGLLEYTKNGQVTEPPLYRFMKGNVQSFLNSIPDPSKMTPEQQLAMGLNANPIMGLLGATAFHGSPYTFNKFDINKVGSGEGAQMYGHGIYFAENPEVAKQYQTGLSKDVYGELVEKSGNKFNASDFPNGIKKTASYVWYENPNLQQAKKRLDQIAPEYLGGSKEDVYKEIVNLSKSGVVPNKQASLYKVDIPDTYIPKMLDWDKPLSSQNEQIQSLLKPYAEIATRATRNYKNWQDVTSGDAYKYMKASETQQQISKNLLDIGVPGIKYLDELSRGKGNGTHNYVVFDPTDVKILERNNKGLLD